ncbi:hypothetical protein B0H17DRAFT_1126201 [Mycena rosella]|uniref:Uncharacterized protein n=1 Tax=Mycena rosella TaxID=1033263 RepID=A0AAD7GUA4_MYCRO|nr:hypothetical protein B0H17DRAFT_1126201 [Mycena rosella]
MRNGGKIKGPGPEGYLDVRRTCPHAGPTSRCFGCGGAGYIPQPWSAFTSKGRPAGLRSSSGDGGWRDARTPGLVSTANRRTKQPSGGKASATKDTWRSKPPEATPEYTETVSRTPAAGSIRNAPATSKGAPGHMEGKKKAAVRGREEKQHSDAL